MKSSDQSHSFELQSLRGLAAIIVLLHHGLRTLNDAPVATFVSEVILNAHAAVVLFFVLSGYVLTKSILSRGFALNDIIQFWVRRAFRIYPALWVGLFLSALYLLFFQPIFAPNISPWVASLQRDSLARGPLLASIIGLGGGLLPPSWTVKVELLASLVLPLLVVALCRFPRLSASIVLLLATVSFFGGEAANQFQRYMVHFGLGALFASSTRIQKIDIDFRFTIISAIILMFIRLLGEWGYHDPVPALIEGVASACLIAGLVRNHAKWLSVRPLVLVGDWSYSLYLVHVPVAFALTRIFDTRWGLSLDALSFVIALSTLAISLTLSAIIFALVERPFIRVGSVFVKYLTELRWGVRERC